jgi:acrylyl-CoA reductase (NADPH)
LVPVPRRFDLKEAMAIGTAGFTAMLAVLALEEHGMKPDGREVVVTGAGGAVGGLAVALLAALGYTVVAETGRAELHDYLKSLGAHEIIARTALEEQSGPMGSARWGGAVDAAGGAMLAGVLRTLAYGASVAACGNAAGFDVHTSVLPFILRAVNVLGIDSLPTPYERRVAAWERLARDLPPSALERVTQVEPLSAALDLAPRILAGQTRGRIVLDVNA